MLAGLSMEKLTQQLVDTASYVNRFPEPGSWT